MKVGVFGGTFDPVHIGHLIVADEARALLGLDEVLFIPTGQPWLKAGQRLTPSAHRMAMTELAVASNPMFRAMDLEIARPGATYTVDTLVELRDRLEAGAEIFVIMGLDALREIARWRMPHRIFESSTVVGMSRPGFEDFDPAVLDSISAGASARLVLLDGPLIDVSGTRLRRRVAEGLPIKYLVPEAVEAYIYDHGLYRESLGREK